MRLFVTESWTLVSVPIVNLPAVMKYPRESNKKKEEFVLPHSLKFYSIMMGKSQWQGQEAAKHIALLVRKLRLGNACGELTLFFSVIPQS